MRDQQRADICDRVGVIAALRELIEALDRRVRHVERLGEVKIARDAAALRSEALARIQELTGAESNRQMRNTDFADAIMSDDGGPARNDEAQT